MDFKTIEASQSTQINYFNSSDKFVSKTVKELSDEFFELSQKARDFFSKEQNVIDNTSNALSTFAQADKGL